MSENKPRRKLAAILAADVVGFSKMMGQNEDRTLENLEDDLPIYFKDVTFEDDLDTLFGYLH
tara:strand:+ start:662 stop:847 length:186 start_codon:yes stop_codon:yes gene_type:complete